MVPDDLWAYHGQLLAYAEKHINDPQLAPDLVSHTYLIALSQWDSVAVVQPRAWLYSLLRGRILNARRFRVAVAHVPDTPSPFSSETEALGSLTVAACLAYLTPPLRDVMALIYLDGFTRQDAAAKLGISRGVLNYRLSTARRMLRDCLRKDDL